MPRSGSITFSIYGADESGFPPQVGNFIQNISGSIPVSNFSDGSTAPFYALTGLNVSLSPNTYYYLVANYPNAPGNGNLYWYQGVIDNTNPAYDDRWSDSADGTTWRFAQQNAAGPLKATINAVPEPAMLGLAAVAGLAGVAASRRRSSGRRSARRERISSVG